MRLAVALLDYLLGFLALVVFASLAFSTGTPTDERMLLAFKVGAALAVVELGVLYHRSAPANRLIVGANLWLVAGGLAAVTQQWWWLKGYAYLGEASLFISMFLVGLGTTVFSSAGFVGAQGQRRPVVLASLALLAAVLVALAAAVHFRGNVRFAAVVPVIALSWVQRALHRAVPKST
jgi:hypothetical protein